MTVHRRSHNFAEQQYSHLLCISPDAPTNPVLYWLGNMSANPTRFHLEGAKGPLHLDLGDVLYAPNLMIDSEVHLTSRPVLAQRLCLSCIKPGVLKPAQTYRGGQGVRGRRLKLP